MQINDEQITTSIFNTLNSLYDAYEGLIRLRRAEDRTGVQTLMREQGNIIVGLENRLKNDYRWTDQDINQGLIKITEQREAQRKAAKEQKNA